jgi:hypothetical protein
MDFFKQLLFSIQEQDAETERLVAEASALFDQFQAAPSIGLTENRGMGKNVPVRKGDVIIDTSNGDNQLVVATGETQDDKPVVQSPDGARKTLEPEFVVMGVAVSNPALRQAAKKLAIDYPTRRILTYGVLPSRNPLGEAKNETTSDNSTVCNDPQPWETFIKAGEKKPEDDKSKKKKGKK